MYFCRDIFKIQFCFMTWKQIFTSSIGKKLVMGLTGLFLILFLIVHAGLNACIWAFDGGEMFNKAAFFMTHYWAIKLMEIGLFLFIILHIIQAALLTLSNTSKRGDVGYAVPFGNRGSKWYSRNMGILGTLLFLFLVIHLSNFFIPSRLGQLETVTYGGTEYHNMFLRMQEVFQIWWIVLIYVIGCFSLAYHLAHGFESAFRTIGVYNNRYLRIIKVLGYAYAILIPFIFAMMPISFYFGWVK